MLSSETLSLYHKQKLHAVAFQTQTGEPLPAAATQTLTIKFQRMLEIVSQRKTTIAISYQTRSCSLTLTKWLLLSMTTGAP